MNTLKTATHAFIAVACALAIHSKSFAEPANLSQLKTEISAYHDSGAYEKEVDETLAPAVNYIIQRAQANEKSKKPQKLAIVLDIDETCLSNYNDIHLRDFSNNKEDIYKTMNAGHASVINPMLALFNTALKHNVAVFFVTGRTKPLEPSTIKNLKAAGYHDWAGIYLRPDHYKQPSIATFKIAARKAITEKGYTILASIGDQKSDVTGGYAEKAIKLPNPYYYIP